MVSRKIQEAIDQELDQRQHRRERPAQTEQQPADDREREVEQPPREREPDAN